jgi:hypothetical protein
MFSRSVGFGGRVDADFDIGPTNYNFVEVRNFGAPRLRTVLVQPRENITIINQTTNITRIRYVNNVVYNEGPQFDVMSRESARPIRRLKLQRREDVDFDSRKVRGEQLRARVEGDTLQVVAPTFDTKPATAPRKFTAKVEKAEVDRGWKDAGPPAEVEKLRTKIKGEPATPAEIPPQSKTEKTVEEPAASPVPEPEKRRGKGKPGEDAQPPSPAGPATTETVPTPSDGQKAADKPLKARRATKPKAANLQPPPPAAKEPGSPGRPEKRRIDNEIPRRPVEAAPQKTIPERKPTRVQPPASADPVPQEIRPGKGAPRPRPEQSTVRRIKPNVPEPRPQAKKPELRRQPAPAIAQPPQPATRQGKGKGKRQKGDEVKPEGVPE